jgi:hypothetical protein
MSEELRGFGPELARMPTTTEPFTQLCQEAWEIWQDIAKQNDQKLATGYSVRRVEDAPEYGATIMAAFAQWCQNKQTMAYDRARHHNEADQPNAKSLPEVYAIEVVHRTSLSLGRAEATLDLLLLQAGDVDAPDWPIDLQALVTTLRAYREMRDAEPAE